MEQETIKLKETQKQPAGTSIRLSQKADKVIITIPAKGLKGKGLITVSVIAVWMFTMLVWSILLLMMKPVNVLYSLPFWAIVIITLVKSLNMLRLEQTFIIGDDTIILRMQRGSKTDERQFLIKDSVVKIVEGPFYSFTGLSKRGQYPAVIYKEEAFGFAERSSPEEKAWLTAIINNILQMK